jgi:hypothetical protein
MAETTNVVVNLETLYAGPGDAPTLLGVAPGYPTQVHVWTVFFKLDGSTVQLRNDGRFCGPATIFGTQGVGPVCTLAPNTSTVFPAEVGQWSDQIVPIPVEGGGVTDAGFGLAVVLVQPGNLEADALVAGHGALNEHMQTGLNDAIANLPPHATEVPANLIALVKNEVSGGVAGAVKPPWLFSLDWWHLAIGKPVFGVTFGLFDLTVLPMDATPFDQTDLGPSSPGKQPGEFSWSTGPSLGVDAVGFTGAVQILRRNVGQGVLQRFPLPVVAVAGFSSPDGDQHAIAATNDGELTEMWWQGPGQASSGYLAHFDHHEIVGLAGYFGPDGYQHVIAATDDGTVYERYWQGRDVGGENTLTKFGSPIRAIAGYPSGDGFQHVIVATADGNITELYWQTGAVGRGTLTHLVGTVVDLAGFEADGVNNVIVATADGNITKLIWSGAAAASPPGDLFTVEAQPWNHVLGVGAYDDGQESHVIVGMSNGSVREFHFPRGGRRWLHTDLAVIPNMVPIIDAYSEAGGFQHVIAATSDGGVHELWWNPSESQSTRTTVVGGLHTVGPLN